MEQILLINPKARSTKMARRTRRTRRAASPAQRAARAKFAAMARARRRNPAPRRAKRRSNPRVRHHYLTAPHITHHRRRHHRRHNPIGSAGMKGLLMPAIKGAAGAVLVDAVFNFLPLPATLTTGTIGMVTKAAAAVALGTMGRKAFGHSATDMAIGSLTVQTYGLLRQLLPASITGLGYISPGVQVGANVPPAIAAPAPSAGVAGLGMYLNSGMGLGEYVH